MTDTLKARLGRLHAPDSRDHLMRVKLAAEPPPAPLPPYKFWRPGDILDQGDVPACVAYAWTGFELCTPTRSKLASVDTPLSFYAAAQAIDEWAGTPHDGTSVRAGAKVMASEGRIAEYVFETDITVVKQWILTKGPVVFGTNWYDEMFHTSPLGYIHIGGAVAGGHAYLVDGFSDRHQAFRCRNSWGPDWGVRGTFWISLGDATRLLMEDGEACATVEIPK
jgi:hypothetical protein